MVEAESFRMMMIAQMLAAEQAFLLWSELVVRSSLLRLVTASSMTSPSFLPASERGCQRLCCHRAARSCQGVAGGENKGGEGEGKGGEIGQRGERRVTERVVNLNSGWRTLWNTIRIRRGILTQVTGEVALVNNRNNMVAKIL